MALALSACGGRMVRVDESDSSNQGLPHSAAQPGTGSTQPSHGTTPPSMNTTTPATGSTGGSGPTGTQATGGSAAIGGATHTAGAPSVAGSGGAIHEPGGAAGAAGEGPDPSSCTFLYLGDWQRCEGDDTDHWVKRVPNKSLADCELACLQDPQCNAVVDYYWLNNPNLLECVLSVGSCEHPSHLIWAEEDAGKEYRKVCN